MVRIIAYILTILLFVGPPVLFKLNFPVEGVLTPYYYPGFYFIVLAIAYVYWKQNTQFMKTPDKHIWLLLILVVFSCLIFGIRRMLLINSIALPALYGLFFANMNLADMKSVRKLSLIHIWHHPSTGNSTSRG